MNHYVVISLQNLTCMSGRLKFFFVRVATHIIPVLILRMEAYWAHKRRNYTPL